MIRKVGRKYILKSKTSGRKLGEFTYKKAALKRERQINYFKNKKK
jgi:hypothetical protein